jgi:hypothetical protein
MPYAYTSNTRRVRRGSRHCPPFKGGREENLGRVSEYMRLDPRARAAYDAFCFIRRNMDVDRVWFRTLRSRLSYMRGVIAPQSTTALSAAKSLGYEKHGLWYGIGNVSIRGPYDGYKRTSIVISYE